MRIIKKASFFLIAQIILCLFWGFLFNTVIPNNSIASDIFYLMVVLIILTVFIYFIAGALYVLKMLIIKFR